MHTSNFSPVAGRVFRVAALALAALLLGTQILAALEYTDGASFYTRVSAVSVMVALAVLPAAFEYARRVGAPLLALSVVLTGTAFLTYSLPATLSRAGGLRELAAEVSTDYERARAEREQANTLLNQCLNEALKKKKDCSWFDKNVQRLDKATQTATDRRDDTARDQGTTILAYWVGYNEQTVRRFGILAYALGVEFGIAILVAIGCRSMPVPAAPPLNMPPGGTAQEKPAAPPGARRPAGNTAGVWLSHYMKSAEQPLSVPEAYAIYTDERKGKRSATIEKFTALFQREAKRLGMTVRQEGRRRLYAVA